MAVQVPFPCLISMMCAHLHKPLLRAWEGNASHHLTDVFQQGIQSICCPQTTNLSLVRVDSSQNKVI